MQPDLSIIFDPRKIDDRGCKGVPDMVIEILSPSTRERDQDIKLKKYLAAGVIEYWIIDPDEQTVFVYLLENGKHTFKAFKVYESNQSIPVGTLNGCIINLAEIFPSTQSEGTTPETK